MLSKRDQLASDIKKLKILELKEMGFKASKAAKMTGYSYKFVRLIYDQELVNNDKR